MVPGVRPSCRLHRGARQMVIGMYQMQRKGYGTGLVSMCIGGDMGMAMIE